MSEIIVVSSGRLTSGFSCMVVLLLFLFIVIYNVKHIYRKYSNDIPTQFDLDNILYDNLDEVLDSHYKNNNTNRSIMDKIGVIVNNLRDVLPSYTNKIVTDTNTEKNNAALESDLQSKLDKLNSITTKMINIQTAQMADFDDKYTKYQQKIQNYVDNLKNMLVTISTQVTTIRNNPLYKTLVNPLVQIFTSIKTALEKNSDFIKTAYPGYTKSTVETPTTITEILPTTNEAPNILSRAGYIA